MFILLLVLICIGVIIRWWWTVWQVSTIIDGRWVLWGSPTWVRVCLGWGYHRSRIRVLLCGSPGWVRILLGRRGILWGSPSWIRVWLGGGYHSSRRVLWGSLRWIRIWLGWGYRPSWRGMLGCPCWVRSRIRLGHHLSSLAIRRVHLLWVRESTSCWRRMLPYLIVRGHHLEVLHSIRDVVIPPFLELASFHPAYYSRNYNDDHTNDYQTNDGGLLLCAAGDYSIISWIPCVIILIKLVFVILIKFAIVGIIADTTAAIDIVTWLKLWE